MKLQTSLAGVGKILSYGRDWLMRYTLNV